MSGKRAKEKRRQKKIANTLKCVIEWNPMNGDTVVTGPVEDLLLFRQMMVAAEMAVIKKHVQLRSQGKGKDNNQGQGLIVVPHLNVDLSKLKGDPDGRFG